MLGSIKYIRIYLRPAILILKYNLASYLLISFLLFGNLSCKKEKKNSGPTSVSGKVYTTGTTNIINGAKVWLYEIDHTNWSTSLTPVAEMTTNASGSYYFDFNARENISYALLGVANKHFLEENYLQWDRVMNLGGNNSIDIRVDGHAYIKLRLLNQTNAKTISLSTTWDLQGEEVTTSFDHSKDTTIYRMLEGTKVNTLYYYVHHESMKSYKIQKEFIAHDTTSIEIKY